MHSRNTTRQPGPPAPELDRGWEIKKVTLSWRAPQRWRAQHPIFGATAGWERKLTAQWAARILECRYGRVAAEARTAALRHGDAPPAASTPYPDLLALLVRYLGEGEPVSRARAQR